VWDDDGSFRVFDRQNGTWDEQLLLALGKKGNLPVDGV
jgi:hypothetical protein